MIKVGRNGMVKTTDALASRLPIFDFTSDQETGIEFDHCSRSQLAILELYLTGWERENLIVAFLKDKNYRGLMPLYSLQMMLKLKNRKK